MTSAAPVIAIDGPSASGKGTVALAVAGALKFHYLDSGSLYRLVALAAIRVGVGLDDEVRLGGIAKTLDAEFQRGNIIFCNEIVTDEIRTEAVSTAASRVAALASVRSGLLARQRMFRRLPGLVAEGRDMGSVVFPDAELKVFLTASAKARAARRYNQLKEKGIAATLSHLMKDLRERDARDVARSVAPLKQCPDAYRLNTTAMSVMEAADRILAWYRGANG
jgi:cytidylate kinase